MSEQAPDFSPYRVAAVQMEPKLGAIAVNRDAIISKIGEAGRAGARFDLGSGLALKAAFGTGFKAPSFYALANPFVGNRDLRPEKSEGGEIGLAWTATGGDTASVALFHTRYKGLIDFIPGPPPRLENRDLVVSKGVSVAAAHAFSGAVTGTVQVQYARTEDDGANAQLLNRPRWRVNAALDWRPSDTVRLILRHAYVGDRDDYATPVGQQTMRGYNLVSVEAAWTFAPRTTARIVVDNALDDDHEDALGFAAPKAGVRLFLSRSF